MDGRPRLGRMDSVNLSLQCVKDRKEWGALVHTITTSTNAHMVQWISKVWPEGC